MSRKVRVAMGRTYVPAFVRCLSCTRAGLAPLVAAAGCPVCRRRAGQTLAGKAAQSPRRQR